MEYFLVAMDLSMSKYYFSRGCRGLASRLATQSTAEVYERSPATFISYLASKPPRSLPFTPQEIYFFITLSLG